MNQQSRKKTVGDKSRPRTKSKRIHRRADRRSPGDPPSTPDALHAWIADTLGVRIVREPLEPDHGAPFDYITHTFFEGTQRARPLTNPAAGPAEPSADCVVWANRGGGKSYLAALATLLDMLFKPGIQIRMLGGSLDQSRRMLEHLEKLIDLPAVQDMARIKRTRTGFMLGNGSGASVLTASQRAVRGLHVQKLRCDEVDLFDQRIWQAAHGVPISLDLPGPWGPTVRGGIEALSTMHRPYGVMWKLAAEAAETRGPGALRALRVPVFRWGLLDVLGHCPDERTCDTCALLDECRGRLKTNARGGVVEPVPRLNHGATKLTPLTLRGHYLIADAIETKGRMSAETWRSEMLCLTPRKSGRVYSAFDRARHIVADAPGPFVRCIAGMDFGIKAEAVILLAGVDARGDVTILHERCIAGETLIAHTRALKRWIAEGACPGRTTLDWIGVDPAGRARSDQTGRTNVDVLTDEDWSVRWRAMHLADGIDLVRRRLHPAWENGPGPRLFIHERCTRLIECMNCYRYNDAPDPEPVKDGVDHACDALRYLIANLDREGTRVGRGW